MKEFLSRVGIGSARVDTKLPSSTVRAGESIDAEVHVEGGSTEQEVDAIYFALETEYRTEDGYREAVVDKWRLTEPFTIDEGQERRFETTIDVPRQTPVTAGSVSVEVETGLDISMAVDPDDEDRLDVRPTERLQAVFDALEDLGFSLHSSECSARPGGVFSTSASFVQEFEFRPRGGEFSGEVDEVEVVPVYGDDGLTVHAEVDRRGGLLSEAMDVDERHTSFRVTSTDPDDVRAPLADTIRELS